MNWQRRITAITGSEVVSSRKLAGGDLGGATYLKLADGREWVAKDGPLAMREGAMLEAIAATGAPARAQPCAIVRSSRQTPISLKYFAAPAFTGMPFIR